MASSPVLIQDQEDVPMQLVPIIAEPITLPSKQLSSNRLTASVSHTVVMDPVSSLHTVETVAISGATVVKHRWTIGPDDGPLPEPPTADELQATLDQTRADVANTATWRETVRVTLGSLK